LAKTYHPDRFTGDSEPFRQVQEAYAVLSDQTRRHAYEQTINPSVKATAVRPTAYSAPEPLIPEPKSRPMDLGEISPVRSFETVDPSFDEVFDWFWHRFAGLQSPKSGRLQHLTMEVPLTRDQARVGGKARVMVPARRTCPACGGDGRVGFFMCTQCAGEGAASGELPIDVDFPPGLARDHAVVIPLQRFGIRDLRLTVVFRPTAADRL
jgi:DnaJ-class molecular chaperone